MDRLQPKKPSASKQPLHHALKNNLQTLIKNNIQIPKFSISNPYTSQKETLIDHALNNLQINFSKFLQTFSSSCSYDSSSKNPSILDNLFFKKNQALSAAEIKKRMYGIPVYTISNYSENRCSVFSENKNRDVELFFFSKSDAEDYMQQFGTRFGDLHALDVPLTDIVGYEGIGAPIRLVPELSQVKNALQERRKDIADVVPFSGVPVFQTDHLRFGQSVKPGKEYCPVFLRKEDLEKTLARFQESDPSIKKEKDNIQVIALEDIIQTMKDCSTSKWNDAVFIGPGLTLWTWLRRNDQLL